MRKLLDAMELKRRRAQQHKVVLEVEAAAANGDKEPAFGATWRYQEKWIKERLARLLMDKT